MGFNRGFRGLDGRLHVASFLIFFLGGVGGSNGKRNASILGVSFQFVWGIFEEGLLSSLSMSNILSTYQLCVSNRIIMYIFHSIHTCYITDYHM